jgi:hypothetical protein
MQGGVMEIVFLIGRFIFGVYWINAGNTISPYEK